MGAGPGADGTSLKVVAGGVAVRDVGARAPKVEGAAKLELVTVQNATMDAAINTARHDLIFHLPFARDG
jgi:hypothetical protein